METMIAFVSDRQGHISQGLATQGGDTGLSSKIKGNSLQTRQEII